VGEWFALRARLWIGIAFGLVLGLGTAGVYYLDTALRVTVEQNINRNLKGYTAHVGAVSFHPIGFSIDLLDTTLAQTAHPEPPVLSLPLLHASVQWKALLHLRLVADFLLERPKVYVDLTQARAEIRSPTPTKDEGWQQALESQLLKVGLFTAPAIVTEVPTSCWTWFRNIQASAEMTRSLIFWPRAFWASV
jgi:hypothetical protein